MSGEKRDLLDWLVLRAPAVATAMTAGLVRLKLGSPLRGRLMNAVVKRGFDAVARSDIDVSVLLYEPGTEVWMHGMQTVGVGGCFRGREGVRALYGEIDDAFDRWEWTIDRLVDAGDRLAVRGDFVGYGRGSGVKTELTSGGTVMEISSRARSRARSGSSSRTAGSGRSKPPGCRSSDVAGEHETGSLRFRRPSRRNHLARCSAA